ncbi:MAG TPA: histone deacetylase [Acidimicrobiales bacterium]|nr:histone deacetylase [Acidimicrobiales bacterium]
MSSALTVVGPSGGFNAAGVALHHGGGHPEQPARINAAMAGVAEVASELGESLELIPTVPAPSEALLRVHTADHLARLETLCRTGGGNLDPDTFAGVDSWDAALLSAGGGLQAVASLRDRGSGAAFVVTRPPGHHALADRAMGFCLLNNVAVTAAALVAEGERVCIVDWDVHHGNGTQDIFWDNPSVLYVSTHQSPFYPGTGWANQVGGPEASGLTVNVPLPAGATGDVVLRALEEVAAPVVEAFAPTWVLISAGFDAHRADPLAQLSLSSADFGQLARVVAGFAPTDGRVLALLEGGYDLGALTSSTAATLRSLVGAAFSGDEAPTSGGPGDEAVRQTIAARQRALDSL